MDSTAFKRLALCGITLAVSAALAGAQADELSRFAGYTRPGFPDDKLSGDKIQLAADDPQLRDQAIGGTIYYRVLRLKGDAADSWGSGVPKFDSRFKPGVDLAGASSPELDTTAKYLYLYQVVNDRQTVTPIYNVSVKLLAEPKDITSWGYFDGVGFAVRTEGDGEDKGEKIRPVSLGNILGAEALSRIYRSPAPPVAAPKALELSLVPMKVGEAAPQDKGGQRIVTVMWDAFDPAVNPNFVTLLPESDFNQGPCFRAVWTRDRAVKKGTRSTVFGFTSNLQPTFESVRMRGPRLSKGGVVPVALGNPFENDQADETVKDNLTGAEGKAPTPQPLSSPAGRGTPQGGLPVAGGMPAPGMGGIPPLGGGPTGGGAGGGGGFTPPPPVSGGGGSGSGGGNNSNGQTGSQTGNNSAAQQGNQSQTQIFNPIIVNLQAQGQQQQQRQQQEQQQQQQFHHQRQGHGEREHHDGTPHEVVPAPSALLLAVIGLPALFLFRRRRKPLAA
jgi:hypothetical protein